MSTDNCDLYSFTDGTPFVVLVYGMMLVTGAVTVRSFLLMRVLASSTVGPFWMMIPFATCVVPLPVGVSSLKSLLSHMTVANVPGRMFLGRMILFPVEVIAANA